jgi:hypothetical protein
MGRIIKARERCGWTIAYPTIGTDYQYQVSSPVRPEIVKRFRHLADAEAWCLKHDVTDEAMAQAWARR